MLATPVEVIRALVTYTDWWQPQTASLYHVGSRRRAFAPDGISGSLLDSLPERDELCRRMQELSERERQVLCRWYVGQSDAREIAKELHISRRHCFRLRSAAIDHLIQLGDPDRHERSA